MKVYRVFLGEGTKEFLDFETADELREFMADPDRDRTIMPVITQAEKEEVPS